MAAQLDLRDEDSSGSGSGDNNINVIVGATVGSVVILALVIIAFICCIAVCVRIYRKKKEQSTIESLPKFRVLDTPNPNMQNIKDNRVHNWNGREESIPLTISTSNHPLSTVSSEYSYATPNEFRIMTATGIRETNDEHRSNDQNRVPGASPQRIPSPYSEPMVIRKYGSTSNAPRSPSPPVAVGSYYMVPETDEQSLYTQIKSLSVKHISREDIQTVEDLGAGNFGMVYKGYWKNSVGNELVAIKTLKSKSSTMDVIKFLQEAAIMGQFHHLNIVKLHGVVTVGEPIMIILEFMDLGDLKSYLAKLRESGPESNSTLPQTLLNFCQQIASGMKYLSNKGFVHRDIAARNILVTQKLVCKIGDFGLARDLVDEDYYISCGGKIPVKWTAPEALSYRKYSSASDVWSFGVLVFEIWCLGQKPFNGRTNQEYLRLVDSGYRLPPPPGCPRAIYNIMIQCWNPDPYRRPTFDMLEDTLLGDETELLHLSDTMHHGSTLGADLSLSEDLYTDLQMIYML